MTEPRASEHSSSSSREPQRPGSRRRVGLWVRVILFTAVVIGCGFYAGFFQGLWRSFYPLTCAAGSIAAFAVNFDAFPARVGDQDNLCAGLGDGACQRSAGEDAVRGECRGGRMHGRFSVTNAKSGATIWSGSYCDGWPCGEFRHRIDPEHENVFRVENLHIHGPATLWERQDGRLVEFSGHYERGKRVGRWVRRIDPKIVQSAVVYDEQGLVATTSFYCSNGNLKEIRGKRTFIFDPQGKAIAPSSPTGALEPQRDAAQDAGINDQSLCPLP